MPAAIIPAALGLVGGVVSDISSNSQQKAAQKNNDNQNAAARAQTQQAYQDAQNNLGTYIAANPAPFQGAQGQVQRPPTYAPFQNQTGGGAVASGQAAMTPPQSGAMGAPQALAAQGTAPQQAMNPAVLAMIQQILGSRMGSNQQQRPPTPTMPLTRGPQISL